jgi:phage gpG-like protein
MAATKVRVEGADRMERTLRAAGKDVGAARELHRDVGALVAQTAEPKAPRMSGRLAASIRSSGVERAAVVRAGGASIPYAGVQEFGWAARGIPASPFLMPALSDSEGEILHLYEVHVDQLLATVKGD